MTDPTPSEPPVVAQPVPPVSPPAPPVADQPAPPVVQTATPPGWYPDTAPGHEGQKRWWDGAKWTDQYQPVSGGRGTAALVLGIVALVLAFIPALNWVGLVLAIVAIILGAIGFTKPLARSRSMTGLILGAVAFVVAIVFGVIYTPLFTNVAADSSNTSSQSGSGSGSSQAPKSAAPKVNPYDKKYGTFTTINQSGSGDTVIPLPSGFDAGVVTASYAGSDNFIVNGLDANNQPTGDGPVNVIGAYKGTTLIGFDDLGGKDVSLQVQASGPWTITIAPISSASSIVPATGSGDTVFLYSGGAAVWSFTSNGQDNFIVNEYSDSFAPGIGINAIGAYSGKDPVDAGPAVVELISDGNWTIGQ